MMRVLIVDGDPSSAQLVRESAGNMGASTMEVGRADDALALIGEEGEPAAVFCECVLPDMGGLWLAERLRKEQPDTAIVMMTDRRDAEAAIASFHCGAVDHLLKPLARERVADALRRAFDAHSRRRAIAAMQREFDTRQREVTEAYADLEHCIAMTLQAVLALRQSGSAEPVLRAHRIARLAVNVGLVLGIGETRLSHLERAVFLRELGPTPTPDEERALESLRRIPMLTTACELALSAHERYDGSGPRGLRGDEIPFEARIIAVAAAYDDLLTGVGEPARVTELISSGPPSTFDPAVVAALERLHPSARPPAVVREGRRWVRKPLTKVLPAELEGRPAALIDVSYGGIRLELQEPPDALPTHAVVDVPDLGLHVEATCQWKARRESTGLYWCGVALPDAQTHVGSSWRATVDALSSASPASGVN
jgi:response regulator RpfG family c-di-GMP phosphodiesterase